MGHIEEKTGHNILLFSHMSHFYMEIRYSNFNKHI